MRLIKVNRDLILRCRFFQAEFIYNCRIGRPNWGEFSTGKHKYIHFGRHVLAIHFK